MKDEELIQQFYEGNQEAFTMLFERHKSGVLNFAMRMTGNRPDAEDVTSETFLRLCDPNTTFTPSKASFKTWLYTITRNSCIDRLRSKKRWASFWFNNPQTNQLQEMDVVDQRESPSQSLTREELAHHVQQAISRLPVDQREALLLREYQSMSYDEIAQITGCSLANVKVLIYRARTQLKDQIPEFSREGT